MVAPLVLAWDLEEKKIILQKQRYYIHLQQPPKDKRLSGCFARLQSLKGEGCSSISAKTSVRWRHFNFAADWGSAVAGRDKNCICIVPLWRHFLPSRYEVPKEFLLPTNAEYFFSFAVFSLRDLILRLFKIKIICWTSSLSTIYSFLPNFLVPMAFIFQN